MTVTGTYSDGTTKVLAASGEKFVSSNPVVATVDTGGVVTVAANAALGATSSVSVTDIASGLSTASAQSTVVTVVAPQPVSIALSPTAFTLAPGAQQPLAVTGTYGDGAVRPLAASGEQFVSSDPSVATVDGNGVVTVAAGAAVGASASISVTDKASGISTGAGHAATVTVSSATLLSIAVSPAAFTLAPGATQQLAVTGAFSDGTSAPLVATAERFVSSSSIATVSGAGLVAVPIGAPAGASASIGVTDRTSGISTLAGHSAVVTVAAATLVSIALAPLSYAASPVSSPPPPLTVTGTYSDGSKKTLPNAVEAFASSNGAIATVNAAGVVAVVSGARVGDTATIGVTDVATGISASLPQSTVVTATLPSPTRSVSAATETAIDDALCNGVDTGIGAFYWEIGDQNGVLASGSVGTTANGPVTEATAEEIASASKLLYASYVTQLRGGAGNLSPTSDVPLLNLTSGHMNMNDSITNSVCPPTLVPDTVAECLRQPGTDPKYPNSYQDPAEIGRFYYNSGHMEYHAGQNPALANLVVQSLGSVVSAQLGAGVTFSYTEPLLSGGVTTTAATYASVLRDILNGSLAIKAALGTNAVCTLQSTTCNVESGSTPFPQEAWHYSIGHWVEDNPATNGDGAFSSGGANGFYPWIDATKSYYGIISQGITSHGYPAIECGRLIRRAFITGIEQTGTLPTP